MIRRGRPEDVPGLAEAMGAAFEADPIASWFWNKRSGRREYIRGWYELVDRYMSGDLDLESLVTNRVRLDQVNDAFEAMERQEGIRTVITF